MLSLIGETVSQSKNCTQHTSSLQAIRIPGPFCNSLAERYKYILPIVNIQKRLCVYALQKKNVVSVPLHAETYFAGLQNYDVYNFLVI